MTHKKDTVPAAAPDTTAMPPATEAGVGTSLVLTQDNQQPEPKSEPPAYPTGYSDAFKATLPGGADFDVASATSEEFDKHFEILARHAKLASLATPVQQVALVDAPAAAVPAGPNPGDIRAVRDGEERYFNPLTWETLGNEKGGWVEAVAKPEDIQR